MRMATLALRLALSAPAFACDGVPRTDCLVASSGGSQLLLGNHLKPKFIAARLVWNFTKGQTVTDFGDPTRTTDYELCLYDYNQGTPSLRFALPAPAGANWQARGSDFRYHARNVTDGLDGMSLGRSLHIHATGTHAWGLPFSSDPQVVVQLIGQRCWSATFRHPTRNVKGQYVGRSGRH